MAKKGAVMWVTPRRDRQPFWPSPCRCFGIKDLPSDPAQSL